ncbi:nose resistant to fluoxetine protein 6-like [Photinus pyralis]|uniref:nose resistant to fluoxetine protein 6-like n=1 Tax=Photinus pyralis TaxID=7054 RepID=UPI001267207E|nr:nose resistant to fluoxetine protein 6-like [Photinus pyralis]
MKVFCLILLVTTNAINANYLGGRFEALSSPKVYAKVLQQYLSKENPLTSKCKEDLLDLVKGLQGDQKWAIHMYDAGAKLQSGILDGNFFALGSFDQCINVRKENSSLEGKYCPGLFTTPIDYIRQVADLPPDIKVPEDIGLSVCLPNSCTASDIESTESGLGFNLKIDEELCQTKATQAKVTTGGYITLGFFGIILILMVASTVYDLICKETAHWALKSFSVRSNGKIIFSTAAPNRNQITCFHGLRLFAMIEAMTNHVYFFRFQYPSMNMFYYYYWKREAVNVALAIPNWSVDLFLFIGGCLVSYIFLLKSAKGVKFNIIFHYIGRYFRLTPPMIPVLLFTLTWFKYVGSGPLWNNMDTLVGQCQTQWWSYLLHIQNFMPSVCIVPTWYISIDFQFYLLSPILLIPLGRWPKFTLTVAACLATLSVLSTFLIAWLMKLPGAYLTPDKNFLYYYYYFLPSKALPWLVGFIFGYIIFAKIREQNEVRTCKGFSRFVLGAAIVVILICRFVVYLITVTPYNQISNSFCLAVTQLGIIPIGYIVYCCHLGYGGVINRFLSNPLFEVVAKLSYNMYLVHHLVVEYNIASIRVSPFLSNYTFLFHDLPGVVFLSFLLAIVLSLGVELPVEHFVGALLNRRKKNA